MPIVRPISEIDKVQWLPLWRGYIEFYKAIIPESQYELTWGRLLDPASDSFGLVAEEDGKLLGIAHYSFQSSTWAPVNYCYLEDLFVSPQLRGNGIGKALIDAVLAVALESGSSRLYWNTDASNSTARRLYDRFARESGKVQYRIQLNGE